MKPVGIDRADDGIDGRVSRPDIAVRRSAQRLNALRERVAVAGVEIGEMQIREAGAAGRSGLVSDKGAAVDDRIGVSDERAARPGVEFDVGRPGAFRWQEFGPRAT
jgi:hypothetical protein